MDESLKQVASVLTDRVSFYAMCLDSLVSVEKCSLEEIGAAFDIIDSILKDLSVLVDLLNQLPAKE